MTATNDFTHAAVWAAIDQIAQRRGLSIYELGRQVSGSHQAFQASNRRTSFGKPIWPSTRTVAKVCRVTGVTFAQFGALVETQRRQIEEAQYGR